MHLYHIAHIPFASQSNILVDKDGTPRIAGLGNAFILPQGKMSTDRLSRSRAPELAGLGASSNLANPTHPTKASDMYAFGVMAFEVWTDSSVCCVVRSPEIDPYRPTPVF